MRFQRQKLPFICNQRRGTLPVRIAWKGDWSSGVSLQYGSANRGQKFSMSKHFPTFFFKIGFFCVSGLWDSFWQKKFSDFPTDQSFGIAMRFQRQKLPFICNQIRGTLPVRITWKGDWSSGVSLQYEGANQGQKCQKIFQLFFQNRFSPCFRILR